MMYIFFKSCLKFKVDAYSIIIKILNLEKRLMITVIIIFQKIRDNDDENISIILIIINLIYTYVYQL
jgi:hypothetical protein